MHDPLAIRFQNVSKIYRLHGSQLDQFIDVLGLQRFGLKTRTPAKEFAALSDITLEVPRGHRIGIVGRNGAGKTTLLKLICGNFTPTSGAVEVNGTVQALMNVGLGFHPEYTGRENVKASLQYNGLAREEYEKAMEGIIDFCELGDFLDQPFKTYSLGMQARLMFAAATAIRPDILIVDEVLGAGDAYFVAKSKARVERLVSSGCTMLLVSHSMQQILELCDEAIWMHNGSIRMQGSSFDVVKSYEKYIHGPAQIIQNDQSGADSSLSIVEQNNYCITKESVKERVDSGERDIVRILYQEPFFVPNRSPHNFPQKLSTEAEFSYEAPGGVSRWEGRPGLKISGFGIYSRHSKSNKLMALAPAKIAFTVDIEVDGSYSCRYGIAIHNMAGSCVLRVFSPRDDFDGYSAGKRNVELIFNPLQLGPGDYTVGISISSYTDLEMINSAQRLDLLSRSFLMTVELPNSLQAVSADFFHSAEWGFGE